MFLILALLLSGPDQAGCTFRFFRSDILLAVQGNCMYSIVARTTTTHNCSNNRLPLTASVKVVGRSCGMEPCTGYSPSGRGLIVQDKHHVRTSSTKMVRESSVHRGSYGSSSISATDEKTLGVPCCTSGFNTAYQSSIAYEKAKQLLGVEE